MNIDGGDINNDIEDTEVEDEEGNDEVET